jgi:flagellar hook-associated protein 1 FlgK
MRTTFFGFEIARRALLAQQTALEVTGHNVANANTDGYTRQRAVLGTTEPFPAPSYNRPFTTGQLGTGVQVDVIRRIRDAFIDNQFRSENHTLGQWEAKESALQQIEVILNEPSGVSLSSVFNEFWNSWQELSKNPESQVVRVNVREQGVTLANAINHSYEQLDQLRRDIDDNIEIKVDEINNIARQISGLNAQIIKVEVTGDQANDLRDKRDMLLDQLSKIINFTSTETPRGVIVYIQGRPLVVETDTVELATVSNPLNDGLLDVVWSNDLASVEIQDGELYGLLNSRDTKTTYYMSQLDLLTSTLITEINNLHSAGFGLDSGSGPPTGNNFFSGTGASDIAVNSALSDLNLIASSLGGQAGDGANALAIAQLKNALTMGGGTATFGDFYKSVISTLGVESQEASRMGDNQSLLVEQVSRRREAVSGVSLDEEVINMLKYQRGYEAASRLMTVLDEMLDRIINQTGLVGR